MACNHCSLSEGAVERLRKAPLAYSSSGLLSFDPSILIRLECSSGFLSDVSMEAAVVKRCGEVVR